jgi:cytochrome c oxidase cbb3-type subunit 1
MWVKHLSSLQFLSYAAFLGVVVAAVFALMPGRKPPVRREPFTDDELGRHDGKLAKYFVTGGAFLVLGSVHMVVKNLPWTAEWLARAGYAGHLVRDLANTHLMIVGGGTLIATGLCWYVLPRIVGRPLASDGLAQGAFWFTAGGLTVFYVAFVANGIAIGLRVQDGWEYQAAKASMGNWYRAPVGMGAGVMGIGYWCFAATVFATIFQARLVRVPKPNGHLWKFLATGAAGLTVGTVQGVIQVQPANADWLYRAGHAGEWIDPIAHAHINLVTGLTMLVAGALFYLAPLLGGRAPSRRAANACFYALLAGSLAFYGSAMYLGFHEGALVVGHGLSPEQAEEATWVHPFLLMAAGIAMLAGFWLLLALVARSYRGARWPARGFVLAGCAALAVGTLQGPIQAFPAVHDLLDRGGDAGAVIVNLHAQLNMLGGLLAMLIGLTLALLRELGGKPVGRAERVALAGIAFGVATYYGVGVEISIVEAHDVASGASFHDAVARVEPWAALVLVPVSLAVLIGFGSFAVSAWRMTARQRRAGAKAIIEAPEVFTGRIPRRVRRRSPAALAGYELPMALLGFPGVGWLFAGFSFTASVLLLTGPAITWAVIPLAFSPYGEGPLNTLGWKVELAWIPATAFVSTVMLYRAQRRRRLLLAGSPPPSRRRPRRKRGYRTRVSVAAGSIVLLLVSLPFVPAVAGVGGSSIRYAYQTRFTPDIVGQFLATRSGAVKLFTWQEPQSPYPSDALRIRARDVKALIARAAAVDDPGAYGLYDLDHSSRVPLRVQSGTGRQLALAPTGRLSPGRYMFVATHQGMFGGRDFAYLTIVGSGASVTPISSPSDRSAPQIADSLLPVAAALVALLFVLLLTRSFLQRPAGQKAFWAAGFACFGVATVCEAIGQRVGWSPTLFRSYYLAGGVLTVGFLGAGSAWLLLPRRGRDALLGALFVAALAAAATIWLAPLNGHVLAQTPSGQPPDNSVLGGHASLWAVAFNSLGSLVLIGGSLYSIARRRRVSANVWIASGALVVALATGLSRTGDYSLVYLGQLVGIAFMFCGFTFAGRKIEPVQARPPEPALERPALAR